MVGTHWYSFLRRYLAAPAVVGSITPSSRYLARALAAPFAARTRPARVLEVGAGTGAVTRHLVTLIAPADHLDICEIEPAFGDILEQQVLAISELAEMRARGRVNLLRCPVQEIAAGQPYDFVISGLPLTAFKPEQVRDVLRVIRANLAPAGIFSYFEYVALRPLRVFASQWSGNGRARTVSAILSANIRRHEFARRIIWRNIPPAYVRHWRFSNPPVNSPPAHSPPFAHAADH